jgi:exonuclease III
MAAAAEGALSSFALRSLNVRGLVSPDKLAALVADLVQAPVSVCFLQETHSRINPFEAARLTRGVDISWPGQSFYSPGEGKQRGCLTLFRHSPLLSQLQQVQLPPSAAGRVLRVDGVLAGMAVSFINVYAPARQREQLPFYTDVLPQCLPAPGQRQVIMGGDFNVICQASDYVSFGSVGAGRGMTRAQHPAALRLLAIMQGDNHAHPGPWLVDTWRALHPDAVDFTCMAAGRQSASRLDRWLLSPALVPLLHSCDIDTIQPVTTDHFPVTARLRLPQPTLFGPGLARVPPTLYDDQAVRAAVRAELQQAVAALHGPAPAGVNPVEHHRVLWHTTKLRVRGLMVAAKRARARAARAQQQQWRAAASAARAALMQLAGARADAPAQVAAAITLTEATAQASVPHRQQQADTAMTSGAVLSQFYNDRPTYYFHSQVKAPHNPVVVRSLKLGPDQRCDLSTAQGTTAALDAFSAHYSADQPAGVFAARPCDLQARQRLLNVPMPRLSAAQALQAEGPDATSMLTAAELRRALMACKRDTAPGQDGLSIEFYLNFWDLVQPLLVAALSEAFQDAASPAPLALFLSGIITLVPKPGKPEDEIKGYRPITLLDMDTRIIARAIADRLQLPLDLVIASSQAAFILGRDISDNIHYHATLADYLQQRAPQLWVCLWDLAGAYDNVDWGLLRASMLAMGFRDAGHVRWARLLHQGARCSVRVNGWLSPQFPLASGLLQGSGASPLYWCIALQPLTNYLSSLAAAGRIHTPLIPQSATAQGDITMRPADPSDTYADDSQTLGSDVLSVDATAGAFDEWHQTGGPSLSRGPTGKSKGFQLGGQAVGAHPHPVPAPAPGQALLPPQAAVHPAAPHPASLQAAAPPAAPAAAPPAELPAAAPPVPPAVAQPQQAAAPAQVPLQPAGPPMGPAGLRLVIDGHLERLLGVPVGPRPDHAAVRAAAYAGRAAAFTAAARAWATRPLSLPGRTHVSKQCLASKIIFQLAYTQPTPQQLQTMQASIRRFVAAHTCAQGDVPAHLSTALFPSQAVLAMPPAEGGMGYPVLDAFATAMQAKLIAQLPGPRIHKHQPFWRLLLADPTFNVCSWVITQPSALQLPAGFQREQDHITAFAKLGVLRIKPYDQQSFFSVMAEPLLFNPAVAMDVAAALAPAAGGPAGRMGPLGGCPAAAGWRYLRDVYAAMHAPGVPSLALTAAVQTVLAALPEPWRRHMRLHPPPLPRFACAAAPGSPTCPASYVVRGSVQDDQPPRSFWMTPTGQLVPLLPGHIAPLGDYQVPVDALHWEPAAVLLLRAPADQLTPEEREQQRLPPAQRPPWPQRPHFLGPWRSVWIDPSVWGWFEPGHSARPVSLAEFTVKSARELLTARHYQQHMVGQPGAPYVPGRGVFPKLWGLRPPAPAEPLAGQPPPPLVQWDSTALQAMEQRWRLDWMDQLAAERDQALAEAGGYFPGEHDAGAQPAWMQLAPHHDPARQQRLVDRHLRAAEVLALEQQPQQLHVPAPAAAPPVPGIDCRGVWKSLLMPVLRVQDRVVAYLILHGSLLVKALQLHCSHHQGFSAAMACCPTCVAAWAPTQLETLTHAFMDCPAVAPALDWMLQVYGALTEQPAPPRDPLVILGDASWIWHPAQRQHSAMWTLLRVTYLGCVWAARCARGRYGGAAAIVQGIITALADGVQRDWARVVTDVQQGAAGVFPSVWFRGRSPQLDAEQFQRLWPAVGGWFQIANGVIQVRLSQEWPVPAPVAVPGVE